MKAMLRLQLAIITLAAIAAAWFWAVPPILTPLIYIHPTNWTDADLVGHLWRFRLIQPERVSSPPRYDYLRWAQAETLARLAVVLLGWLGGAWWILRRHRQGQEVIPPNKAAAPKHRPRFPFPASLRFEHPICAPPSPSAAVGEPRR
jgi:hypothetical protein